VGVRCMQRGVSHNEKRADATPAWRQEQEKSRL